MERCIEDYSGAFLPTSIGKPGFSGCQSLFTGQIREYHDTFLKKTGWHTQSCLTDDVLTLRIYLLPLYAEATIFMELFKQKIKKLHCWPHIIIGLLVTLSHVPTFTGEFILDDNPLIRNNTYITEPHSLGKKNGGYKLNIL